MLLAQYIQMRWQSILNASWLWVFRKDQEISRFFLVLSGSIVSFFQALIFPVFLLFSNWNCEASNAGKNDVWMQIYVPAAVIETDESKHKNPTYPRQNKTKKKGLVSCFPPETNGINFPPHVLVEQNSRGSGFLLLINGFNHQVLNEKSPNVNLSGKSTTFHLHLI